MDKDKNEKKEISERKLEQKNIEDRKKEILTKLLNRIEKRKKIRRKIKGILIKIKEEEMKEREMNEMKRRKEIEIKRQREIEFQKKYEYEMNQRRNQIESEEKQTQINFRNE